VGFVNSRRTLWTEGRHRGRLVANAAGAALVATAAADLLLNRRLTLVFDVVFVLVCTGAALAVRPRDFFVVGVLPPLLMLALLAVLVATARGLVADGRDGAVQAVVSALAHRAGALVVGYALTLGVLALRQVALRNSGRLRRGRRRPVPRQASARPAAPRSAQRHHAQPAYVDPDELRAAQR
jgi:hypothetical protein